MFRRALQRFARSNADSRPPGPAAPESVRELERALAASAAGDVAQAEAILRKVIAQEPRSAAAHALLAELLRANARPAEARGHYERALAIDPDQPELRLHYAAVLSQLGAGNEAEQQYREVVRLRPDWAPGYVNYGVSALRQAQLEKALALLERAAAIEPRLAETHTNLALAYSEAGRTQAAIASCEAALAIDPGQTAALKNLAGLWHQLGEAARARSVWRARIAANPSDGATIAMALALPAVAESLEDIERTRTRVAAELEGLARSKLSVRDPAAEVGVTAFFLAYHGMNDRALQERIASVHLGACPGLAYVAPHCDTPRSSGEERIRLGILSHYLHEHSIGRVMRGLVDRIDRRRFSVHAFSFRPPFDTISETIAGSADEWVTLPRDLAQARTLVAARGLDVLLYPDVGMDPMSYFLTFARLARVQCTTWGHPVTTGVPAIDYFVSTDYFEPDEAQHHYSETLVRLTDVAFPGYYYRPQLPATSSAGAPGFDRGRRVYFCPQTLYKIHPALDAALAAIVRRDPRGEVVIVYDEEADRYRLPQLEARLQRSAPDVADRIVFLPRTANREGYLQRLRAADVVLDTFPYCGGNTSLEAISAGALVVTLPSELNRGRHTYGFFRKMRFTDTVAASAGAYAELAVKIAADADLRMHLKHVQAERCGALYEDASAVRQMEAFFERALAASGRS